MGDGDNQSISFAEFSKGLTEHLRIQANRVAIHDSQKQLNTCKTIPAYTEEEEEEEIPEDLADLPPHEQQKRIIFRASWMMGLGTLVVVVVSDPFVDLLQDWSERTGVPQFFITFVVAPF